MTTLSPPSPAAPTAPPRPAPPVRTEIRRGWWASVVTLGLLVGTLLEVLDDRDVLAFSWVWAHDALRAQGLLFGVPFALFAGCWHGGRERRQGTGELFASLPASPLRRTALAATPAVVWPVLGYLPAAAVCVVATWIRWDVPYGHPFPTLLLADAVAMGAAGLVGFVVGREVPWRLTGPVLALFTGFVMPALTDQDLSESLFGTGELAWLVPTVEHWGPWDAPAWWFGPVASLWFGSVALAVFLRHCAHRRAAVVSLAVALASAAALVGTGKGLWHADPGATALVCEGEKPQVCVVRIHDPYLPEIAKSLEGVTGRLRHVPNAPDRFVEVPRTDGGRPLDVGQREGDAVIEEPSAFDHMADMYAGNAAVSIAEYGCADTRPEGEVSRVPDKYRIAVALWLEPSTDYGPDRGPVHAVLKRIKAMPERERTAWLGDYFGALRDCRPGRIAAP